MHSATNPAHQTTTFQAGHAPGRHAVRRGVLPWLLALLACVMISSLTTACTTASGNGWKYTSVGADTTGLDVSSAGIRAATISQSPAFGKAADVIKGMWTNYLMAEGLKFVSGQYYSHQGKLADQATTVQLEKLRNAKSVTDAKAALDAANAARAAEAAAAGLAPAAALAPAAL